MRAVEEGEQQAAGAEWRRHSQQAVRVCRQEGYKKEIGRKAGRKSRKSCQLYAAKVKQTANTKVADRSNTGSRQVADR